jgi:type I restriction enzyme S subunit
MEVKPGYKQTEVGVIPEEWEVRTIGEVFRLINGFAFKPDDWKQSGTPIIRIQNLNDPFAEFNYSQVPVPERNRIEAGDLLFAWSGTLGSSFGARVWSGPSGVLNQHIFKVLMDEQQVTLPFSLLVFARVEEDIAKQAHGFKASFVHVKKSDLVKVDLPLPPLPEQRAIATALSDVDGLLGGLGRLIAKKRDLKQAAMQQLLTGKTRLPGFHGEWEVRRLEDAFAITAGKSKAAYVVDGGDYWVCDMGSVSIEGRLILSKRTNYCSDFLRLGDLIMPKDDIGGGNIIGKVGYIDAAHTYVLGDHVYCLRALEGDPRFLAYVINSHSVNSALRKKVIGSAQLGLGRKSVNEQEIQFPPHLEQNAIAEVLTEMDAELAALEQRRDKTRALKQAMMQELLTGRTRLV